MAGELLLGEPLDFQVERQHDVLSRGGRLRAQVGDVGSLAIDGPALRIHQDFPVAVRAVQLGLERALDAKLADQRGA